MRKRQGNGKGMGEALGSNRDYGARDKAFKKMSKEKDLINLWKCPKCDRKNLQKFDKCPRCGEKKPKGMKESVTTAENGIMDTLEHGHMTKDEVFKLIKREYKLKKHEFNTAWNGLKDDGDVVSAGASRYKRA